MRISRGKKILKRREKREGRRGGRDDGPFILGGKESRGKTCNSKGGRGVKREKKKKRKAVSSRNYNLNGGEGKESEKARKGSM